MTKKNLDNLTILFEHNFMSFSMVPLCKFFLLWKHEQFCFIIPYQFVLDLLFFFKQFQSHRFLSFFLYKSQSLVLI